MRGLVFGKSELAQQMEVAMNGLINWGGLDTIEFYSAIKRNQPLIGQLGWFSRNRLNKRNPNQNSSCALSGPTYVDSRGSTEVLETIRASKNQEHGIASGAGTQGSGLPGK